MLNIAELDERIEKCLSILAENPHSQVFAALADAYRKRGEFGRAFSVCKGGLRHHPDYAPAHIVLAKLYLHQGMHSEALVAVRRAIAIDGPTRASDLLEAEVLIVMGDTEGANGVIARLRTHDRRNPAVRELAQRVRDIMAAPAQPGVAPRRSGAGSAASAPMETLSDSPPPVSESLTWDEWAEAVGGLPSVTDVFAVGGNGDMLVGLGDSGDTASMGTAVTALFSEIEEELQQRLHTGLKEIRIERTQGEVWCRRRGDGMIGFVGAPGIQFGAARQAAMTKAERTRTDNEKSPRAQH